MTSPSITIDPPPPAAGDPSTTILRPRIAYTVEEAAELLQIPRSTMYDLVKSGEIPAVRLGRRWRIGASSLEQRLNEVSRAK